MAVFLLQDNAAESHREILQSSPVRMLGKRCFPEPGSQGWALAIHAVLCLHDDGQGVRGHRLGIETRIENAATPWLEPGDVEKALANPVVELRAHLLKPGFSGLHSHPLRRPGQAKARVAVENNRQMRVEADHAAVKVIDQGTACFAGGPLDGPRGVDEAVTDDDCPAREGRADCLFQVVASCGSKEKDLSLGRPSPRIPFDKQTPDILRTRGSARLPGMDHIEAKGAERLDDIARTAGLSAPLDTFERDEHGIPFGSSRFVKKDPSIFRKILRKSNMRFGEMGMQFSQDQEEALTRLSAGESLFLTGGAGTGKSQVFREFLRRNPQNPVIRLASTGQAAQLIEGQTVHAFFRLPPAIHRPGQAEVPASLQSMLRRTRHILIDEISMLRIDVFQAVVDRLRACRRGPGPFGGYQLVVVGDFAQLPPVLTDVERQPVAHYYGRDALYAFQSEAWQGLGRAELTTLHRQSKDREFAVWLNKMRHGDVPDLSLINARVGAKIPGAVQLVATNKAAQAINDRAMDRLPGAPVVVEGRARGAFSDREMRVPRNLALKRGSRVILCANNQAEGYVNGSTGTLTEIGRGRDGLPVAKVVLDDSRLVTVRSHTWEASEYRVQLREAGFLRAVTGTYTQLPILPGWAITIHRSQGMSMPRVHIDPDGIFEAGQAYVALSRATSLKGLTLQSALRPRDVLYDKRVRSLLSVPVLPGQEEPCPSP